MVPTYFTVLFIFIGYFTTVYSAKLGRVVLKSGFKHEGVESQKQNESTEDWESEGFFEATADNVSNSIYYPKVSYTMENHLQNTIITLKSSHKSNMHISFCLFQLNHKIQFHMATKEAHMTMTLKNFEHTVLFIKFATIVGHSHPHINTTEPKVLQAPSPVVEKSAQKVQTEPIHQKEEVLAPAHPSELDREPPQAEIPQKSFSGDQFSEPSALPSPPIRLSPRLNNNGYIRNTNESPNSDNIPVSQKQQKKMRHQALPEISPYQPNQGLPVIPTRQIMDDDGWPTNNMRLKRSAYSENSFSQPDDDSDNNKNEAVDANINNENYRRRPQFFKISDSTPPKSIEEEAQTASIQKDEKVNQETNNRIAESENLSEDEEKKIPYKTWKASMDKNSRPPGFYLLVISH